MPSAISSLGEVRRERQKWALFEVWKKTVDCKKMKMGGRQKNPGVNTMEAVTRRPK